MERRPDDPGEGAVRYPSGKHQLTKPGAGADRHTLGHADLIQNQVSSGLRSGPCRSVWRSLRLSWRTALRTPDCATARRSSNCTPARFPTASTASHSPAAGKRRHPWRSPLRQAARHHEASGERFRLPALRQRRHLSRADRSVVSPADRPAVQVSWHDADGLRRTGFRARPGRPTGSRPMKNGHSPPVASSKTTASPSTKTILRNVDKPAMNVKPIAPPPIPPRALSALRRQ